MKLFLRAEGCPQCDALEEAMSNDRALFDLPTRYVLHDDPLCPEDEDAWAEADMLDVMTTPTLVIEHGRKITNVDLILDILREAVKAP